MTPALFLEDFAQSDVRFAAQPEPEPHEPGLPAFDPDQLERTRLEGYEAGYQAGWDDAVRAEAEAHERIGVEFARNLQDLGFTFHEARQHVMNALEPLLVGMIEKVLPALVQRTIGQTIVEELLAMASDGADAPIEIVVSSESVQALKPLLSEATNIPFNLIDEPSLAEGQIYLRSARAERDIDLTGAIERIGTAIGDLYQLNEKAFQNG